MNMRAALSNYWKNDEGAGAAEFAIVLIPFFALVLATIWLCLTVYGNSSLQDAAEQAARCGVVRSWSTSCNTPDNIQAYALSVYKGPSANQAFVATNTGCGMGSWTVKGTASIPVRAVLVNTDIPLSASACFP